MSKALSGELSCIQTCLLCQKNGSDFGNNPFENIFSVQLMTLSVLNNWAVSSGKISPCKDYIRAR